MTDILVGKLNDKVKLSHLKDKDITVGKFHIVFEKNNQKTSIPCVAYNDFAKNLSEHAHQGQEIKLIGSFYTKPISSHQLFIAKTVPLS